MDISKLVPAEAREAVTAMETVEQLRVAATSVKLKFSGNTGEGTLRKNLMEFLSGDPEPTETDETPQPPEHDAPPEAGPVEDAVVGENVPDLGGDDEGDEFIQQPELPKKAAGPTIEELLLMDPNEITDTQLLRQVVRAKAMRLHRVRITNLDPADSQLNGAIVTVYNKYTGKVSKYVPFGDESENGYHIPEILLNQLKSQKFAMRRELKGGAFGVKQYSTKMINKFAIEEMEMLTPQELKNLAAHQSAAHAIDN